MSIEAFKKQMADLKEYRTTERDAAKFIKLLRKHLTKFTALKNRAVKLKYEQIKKQLGTK